MSKWFKQNISFVVTISFLILTLIILTQASFSHLGSMNKAIDWLKDNNDSYNSSFYRPMFYSNMRYNNAVIGSVYAVGILLIWSIINIYLCIHSKLENIESKIKEGGV